jgi:hypothetical protein
MTILLTFIHLHQVDGDWCEFSRTDRLPTGWASVEEAIDANLRRSEATKRRRDGNTVTDTLPHPTTGFRSTLLFEAA